MKTAFSLFLIAVLANAIPASGQDSLPNGPPTRESDVRFVSSFVPAGGAVPSECREEAHVFALTLLRYARPDAWHWVVVCDEAGWRRFLRLSGREEGADVYASTDLTARMTYIRGSKLLYPYDLQTDPDRIIAHELAHIWLQTESEIRADDLVRLWHARAKSGLR